MKGDAAVVPGLARFLDNSAFADVAANGAAPPLSDPQQSLDRSMAPPVVPPVMAPPEPSPIVFPEQQRRLPRRASPR